jgi:hypothetical protein
MQQYVSPTSAIGDFEFQAIAYERNGQVVYQYRTADPNVGVSATIGLINSGGTDPLVVSCNQTNSAPAQSAVCMYAPNAQPSTAPVLRLPQSAPALPALAAGASTTLNLPFGVEASASCGAILAIDFLAAVDDSRHSFNRAAVLNTRVASSCAAVANCSIGAAAINVRQGLYSNPVRAGNGIANFIYGAGGSFGGAWYTALGDRTPIWYLLAGAYVDNRAELPLLRFRNSAAPNGFNATSTTVGRAYLAQADADSLVFAWDFGNGVTGAENFAPVALPFASGNNHSQIWYAPSEPGWGLAIESLNTGGGSVLEFIGSYIYDAAGTARWVVGGTGSLNGGVVGMTSHRPHCPACPWLTDWDSVGLPAGSLNIVYSSRNSAALDTTITLPASSAGSWLRSGRQIVPFAEPSP